VSINAALRNAPRKHHLHARLGVGGPLVLCEKRFFVATQERLLLALRGFKPLCHLQQKSGQLFGIPSCHSTLALRALVDLALQDVNPPGELPLLG
jgi:hypothetical protein